MHGGAWCVRMTLRVLFTPWKIWRWMSREAEILFPVGQSCLGEKDGDNRRFQPDDFDGAPPRE
jgi:hypothetical protein